MSLRQNVTFGRPFCQQNYDKVLDACALKADLATLSQGDKTEIGEKVNGNKEMGTIYSILFYWLL
jgi:hypothetical protein